MPRKPPDETLLADARRTWIECGQNAAEAARVLDMPVSTLKEWLARYDHFDIPDLPNELPTAKELRERRKDDFDRKFVAKGSRKLIPIKVNLEGPIGICHMGDPHVDDDGTDIGLIEKHVDLINSTEGMFAATVGDLQNNWIGRLARLYGEQSTSAQEAWILVEWFVNSLRWLYMVAGNHDLWSGSGDPVKWMMRQQGIYEPHGVRLSLQFPGDREVRVNARHDFHGHSQWNPAHGPAKAAMMGWRDHILTCGHKHVSGYNVLKCPATGLISHAVRVASYKFFDRYAEEKGLMDLNVSPAVVTVIDPNEPDDSPGCVTVFHDVEKGCKYLNLLRAEHSGKSLF